MSEPRTKVADVVATVRARATEYARRLPPAQRDRIASWAGAGPAPATGATEGATTGGPTGGKGAGAAGPGTRTDPVDGVERCVAAAVTREGTRRILASLERDAREALLFFLCGSDVLDDGQFEGQLREFFGWPKSRARGGIDALSRSGLLARTAPPSSVIEAFPALRLGLGPDLLDWLAGATDDAPPPVPVARRLALLVAHAHADPVTLTAQHVLAVRWTDRALDVFGAIEFSSQFLACCVSFLGRTGAMGPDPAVGDGKSWRVEPRVAETLASAPADLALALAETGEPSPWGSVLGTLAVLERARLAGEEGPTIQRLAELGKAWVAEPRGNYLPCFESQFRPLAVASAVRALRSLGLVAVERGEAGVRVRRLEPPPPPPRPFRCTVLPTFEIWVAADADPAGTADLGRVADLTATDRVARFLLTPKSVARAAREPGGAAAAIERLAAAAEHGLPENVRTTLEGWARRATSMRAYAGAVIVAASDEHAAFLRGRAGVFAEIAPGVFHVDEGSLADVLRAADRAGHVTSPVVREGRPSVRREVFLDLRTLAERAEDVRKKLATWTAPSAPRPPRPPATPGAALRASATSARSPDDEDAPSALDESAPLTVRELRDGWPEVASAVSGYPPIERAALRLSIYELDDLAEFGDPVRIRGGVAMRAFDRMPPPRATIGEAPASSSGPSSASPSSASAPPPTSRPATPSRATGEPWLTPKPGELSALLASTVRARESLDVVYLDAAGVRTEKRLLPLALTRLGPREYLEAKLELDHSTTRLELDRIVAVRLVTD